MQLYLRPINNILRQQNNFEWTLEHQKSFDEIRTPISEQNSNTIPESNQAFYATFDAFNFKIGASFLQSHQGTN